MEKPLIYLVGFLFFLVGCNKNTDDDSSKDTIGLSAKAIRFAGIKDTVLIRTEGSKWWFSQINVDGTGIQIASESQNEQLESHKFSKTCDWLTVIREKNLITLIAATNGAEQERTFELSLQSKDESEIISGIQSIRREGEWGDLIGLSKKKVSFPAEGGSVAVETQESGWWVYSIEVDGVEINVNRESYTQLKKNNEYLKKTDWLTVYITPKKIELTAGANPTGKGRTFKLNLEAGDYFDTVTGNQEK